MKKLKLRDYVHKGTHDGDSRAGAAGKPSFRSAGFESRPVTFQRPYCDMLLLNRT